jgi:hypothetical protein
MFLTPRRTLSSVRSVEPGSGWASWACERMTFATKPSRLFENTDLRANEIGHITGHTDPRMLERYYNKRPAELVKRFNDARKAMSGLKTSWSAPTRERCSPRGGTRVAIDRNEGQGSARHPGGLHRGRSAQRPCRRPNAGGHAQVLAPAAVAAVDAGAARRLVAEFAQGGQPAWRAAPGRQPCPADVLGPGLDRCRPHAASRRSGGPGAHAGPAAAHSGTQPVAGPGAGPEGRPP